MIIDPATPIGQVRLRVADFGDIPLLQDSVYQSTLDANQGNIPKTASICAMYILGMLSHQTHRKLQHLEVWGSEAFNNYRLFLNDTMNNPNVIGNSTPIPYSPDPQGTVNPLIQFQRDWNNSYSGCTQSQVQHELAIINKCRIF